MSTPKPRLRSKAWRQDDLLKPLTTLSSELPATRLDALPLTHGVRVPGAPPPLVLDLEQPLFQLRSRWIPDWHALRELYDTAGMMFPPAARQGRAKRARFMFRALLKFSLWRQWHGFLKSSPFRELGQHFARFYEKPLRPYLHKDLTPNECHRVLREHYLFMQQHAPAALVEALLRDKPFLLNDRSREALVEPLILNLAYAKHMQQEGELTLSVGRPGSQHSHSEILWIAGLTFVLQYGGSGWEMLIGGVQGGHSERSKEDVRLATHVFHGLRPKHLLLHLLRELAACWGISHIYAISDEAHCFMRRRYRGRVKIKSSYDELWRDAGGAPAANGFYAIPAAQSRRSLGNVPTRKRAQYRRRYALLDQLDAEVREKLSIGPAALGDHAGLLTLPGARTPSAGA